ncbi:uncharacterized protein [Drosophila virilis]|uniref:Uncharacterized protein n=1 Tax=Drosophila virilis TaxID=7244 RepID=A0A0Q9WEU2_DROVI|nr:uncharacterized protein LOC26531119 [Drosophila virilis]KRF83097.1 uncharacterized protein Dvir_GJ26349 [Drosophila virilis]
MEDTASVYDLKRHLQAFVDIPGDKQEIKTLDRTLNDFDELSKILNHEIGGDNNNGAAISLYTNNQFFCFLKFYNQDEGNKQNNFSQPSNVDHVTQYVMNIIDSDNSWHSKTSVSDSTDNSNSKLIPKSDSPPKRSCSLTEKTDKSCKSTATPMSQAKPHQDKIPVVPEIPTSCTFRDCLKTDCRQAN